MPLRRWSTEIPVAGIHICTASIILELYEHGPHLQNTYLSSAHRVEEKLRRREAAVEAVRHEALCGGEQAVGLEVR